MDANSQAQLQTQLREAEKALQAAESQLGAEHPDLVDKLTRYASLLRQCDRALDAVNVEARAKAIRAKLYEKQAAGQVTGEVKKPVQAAHRKIGPGTFLGAAAVLVALSTLFNSVQVFGYLAPIAVILAVFDLIVSRGQWWRAACCALLLGWSVWGLNTLPPEMLTDATPLDRLNYEVNNPDLVVRIRQLGKDTNVLAYRLRLPNGFSDVTDTKMDWGRVFSWAGPARGGGDQMHAQFSVMAVTVPDDIRSKLTNYPLLKLANQQVMPKILEPLNLSDSHSDTGQVVEINGYDFAEITFSGNTDNHGTIRGFVFVAKDKRTLAVVSGYDSVPFADDSIPMMKASAYTFRKQIHPVDMDL
jgi:hypothetical protein